ncbi:MAG: helicase-related protein [Alphaproteobacteria bacterium]
MRRRDDNGRLVAVLGPTNTGKTHFAIERMLGHSTGMIGLPLRLLAREVYDKVVAQRGPASVALITGEEKNIPKNPSYWICTVESMPVDQNVAFLAVDEIQLAADEERGHTFTDRLLRARGREETMFMGADTIRPLIRKLLPDIEILDRTRFSQLAYAGTKKLSRLPRRSAVVAFSANDVYAIAELIRRRKGGAAVVMGALSPRTRNAQVEMYQNGEVDYIVATDAIGMGLNMAVNHVAFSSITKFDGVRHRRLFPHEMGQIAGRAGRHMNDGTFGLISDSHGDFAGRTPELDPEEIDAIENHRFRPVDRLQWRNSTMDYASLGALIRSLDEMPARNGLTRAREGEDLEVLKMLALDKEIQALAGGPAAVARLWEACQVPDFRKVMPDEHAKLIKRLYTHLMSDTGRLADDWVAGQVSRMDRVDGDIDTLATRIAHVRTWTYIANRSDWLDDPAHWRGETRAIEDRLSDALHERLTHRFVDKRSAMLMKRLQADDEIFATVDASSDVLVEGHYVGRLSGLTFDVDRDAQVGQGAVLMHAASKALRREVASRVRGIQHADDEKFELLPEIGEVLYGGAPIIRLKKGAGPLAPAIEVIASDFVEASERQIVADRAAAWLETQLRRSLHPLFKVHDMLERSHKGDDVPLKGLARGIAFRLLENLGSLPRQTVADDIRKLEQPDRWQLRRLGVRFGEASLFLPAILKPEMTRHRLMCWRLFADVRDTPALPTPGLTSVPALDAPDGFYEAVGFRRIGRRAVRIDMLERVAEGARKQHKEGALKADSTLMSLVGCSGEDFIAILNELGYQARKQDDPTAPVLFERGRPKPARHKKKRRNRRKPPAKKVAHSPFAELESLKSAMKTG